MSKKLTTIHKTIVEILGKFPNGLDIKEIRDLAGIEGQQHLDKRVRELYPFYEIETRNEGSRYIYQLIKERAAEGYDYATVSKTLRAKIIHRDGRRCRMCGKTVDEDQVKLHIDHKIPREWGGTTNEDNLWCLCSGCNEGKRNYFASFDPELMKCVLVHGSVHRRILELLKLKTGEWVECDLVEFVANFEDYQKDWMKRTRELRYFDLAIKTRKKKVEKRTLSYYMLTNWVDNLPSDLSKAAQEFERERARANKIKRRGSA